MACRFMDVNHNSDLELDMRNRLSEQYQNIECRTMCDDDDNSIVSNR